MHHLYPSVKGDPLCPLGFHPQVRWPTRCKRCFRDYKEHGGRKKDEEQILRKDETTLSSPSLSIWSSTRKDDTDSDIGKRNWTSSTNISKEEKENKVDTAETTNFLLRRPASWTSTPDLGNLNDDTHANIPTVSIKLPRRKPAPVDTGQKTVSSTSTSSTNSNSTVSITSASEGNMTSIKKDTEKQIVFNKNDSLATRARKLKAAKESSGIAASKKDNTARRIQVKELKAAVEEPTSHDVQFLIQVKSKTFNKSGKTENMQNQQTVEDDSSSIAGTETTDTTLINCNENELQEQIESLKLELDNMKLRCEKAEREKSDILLRRLAEKETTTSKTTASEMLKLQQKCNEMQTLLEDLQDDKKSLSLKVRELEQEVESRPTIQVMQKLSDELKSKLLAAETLCEELMDENEDMKKELRDMEEEMEEMQDNFREDQADEYTSLKKELEQTTKNCRILSFKLRKTERKVEQLETEKQEAEKKLKEISDGQSLLEKIEKIKHLQQELKMSNEVSLRLQKELDEAKLKITKAEESNTPIVKKKAPMLSAIAKIPSADGKISRESLTRGGSQDDPVQLLRDLQDSLEREADLREQLKFAEEEAQSLRKKASRVEDDNESLVLQLKKMATKARSRKLSPTPNRMTPDPNLEKDEGISDDDDPAELRLLLELSEQEASVLRRKTEEMEVEAETMERKIKDLQEKLNAKTIAKKTVSGSLSKNSSIQDQKFKVLEDETCDLRKKLIEKERDCERLHAELSVTQKRSKGMQKSKSLDGDQQAIDLRRQLQVVEQEAVVLRTKIQYLESENEKLSSENKRLALLKATKKLNASKTTNDDKYIDKIAALEINLENSNKQISELKEAEAKRIEEINSYKNKLNLLETDSNRAVDIKNTIKYLKPRTPKKPTALTTNSQLKTWIIDLEKEIAEYAIVLQKTETLKNNLEAELKSVNSNKNSSEEEKKLAEFEELKKQVTTLEKKVNEYKSNVTKEKNKQDELNNSLLKSEEMVKKIQVENKTFKAESEKFEQEKKKLEEQLSKLTVKLNLVQKNQEDAQKSLQKVDSLQLEVNNKEKEITTLKKELDSLKKLEEEKTKLKKELKENICKIAEVETRVKEMEEKSKKNEKLLSTRKEKISKLETELETVKQNMKTKESEWLLEKNTLESTLTTRNLTIEELNRKVSSTPNTLTSVEEELNKTKSELIETKSNLENLLKNKKMLEEKLTTVESEFKSEKSNWERKFGGLETDLMNEKKKFDRMKINHEKEQKNRELELSSLKMKIHSLEQKAGGSEKISSVKQEYEDRVTKLNKQLTTKKQAYDDLTAKYEILEEEHVVTKAKLVMEKEAINSQLDSTKEKLTNIESELRKLRDTYNNKNDTWIKEKLYLEEQIKDLSKKVHAASPSDSLLLERTRLKSALDEKSSEVEQLKRESEVIEDQLKNLRKENEDLKQKLDDFDKVSKIQRNINADTSALEKELIQMKNKLGQVEKSRKTDVAECKMRYDSQIAVISEELQSLQTQVTRFKRERDTYKHMLEGAQKTLGDLKMAASKTDRERHNSGSSVDEFEEHRMKVATLEQQISCMEDELSEARLESSKLKTELVSERSAWEVKQSEMKSKINELEEDRLLNSGRTKIAGLRTRMELAWHKEREEQTRLLQETSTLARDLRQTLFEVERERDKERLEAKRKQDQLKKAAEEEQEENRRKLNEIQCDLLELRDAHAKLRTTNEKLRREKERQEREREEWRSLVSFKKKSELNEDRRVGVLLEQVDLLLKSITEGQSDVCTPTPPRRLKSKSRESSPAYSRETSRERSVNRADDMHYVIQRLRDATQEIRQSKTRQTPNIRRAASTEHDSTDQSHSRGQLRNGNLNRKSLSLEQTVGQLEQSIWKGGDDNSLSSLQSLDAGSDMDSKYYSMDSRLSGGSTQSEVIPRDKKKKKSLIGTLKKLTKSRSIEEQNYQSAGGDSVTSDDIRGSKKDLKERLTGMFKRSGSSSRSNSVERTKTKEKEERHDSSSVQRPLMRNGGNSSRPSPSPSERSTSLNRDTYTKYK